MRRVRRALWRQRLYPVLGVAAIVVIAVLVYVSYTANGGLPFTSSYEISARVPDAEHLIRTDEVRIAGVRVGQVSSVQARLGSGGRPYSVVGLSLSPSVGELPVDTRIEVQSSSVLGQTFVDLVPGRSATRVRSGGTLPLAAARPTVQLTDLLDVFDRTTGRAIQTTIGGFGYGLAGRGPELNDALSGLSTLLGPLTALSHALAARQTDLAGFLHGFESFAGAVAPVAEQLGGLIAGGSETLAALGDERQELAQAIAALPGAEDAASTALVRLREPLGELATLTVRLRAAGQLLPGTVARINTTLVAGDTPLAGLPVFSARLGGALGALTRLSRMPGTPAALSQLSGALLAIDPLLQALTPAQLDCNVIGLYGRNFSSAWGSLGSGIGPSIVTAGVVTTGANGEEIQAAAPASDLHVNYLAHENGAECESGNEPYSTGARDLANPPGNQSRSVPPTAPPAATTELAAQAGLLTPPPGTPR